MVHTVMVLAHRKSGITHEEFRSRYERHMEMVAEICGDVAPLSHTRYYPKHDDQTDKPILLAGDAEDKGYSVVVLMVFENEQACQEFFSVLSTESANKKIMEDEADFWEREGMKVMIVDKDGA